MTSDMKVCSKCKVEKDYSAFYKAKANKDGFQGYCKECVITSSRKWINANPKKYLLNCKKFRVRTPHAYKRQHVKLHQRTWDKYTLPEVQQNKFHVYLIPEEHYCGYSGDIKTRFYTHYKKRIVKGFELFHSYDTRDEAKLVEAQFHALGWYGRSTQDKKFCLNSWQYEN